MSIAITTFTADLASLIGVLEVDLLLFVLSGLVLVLVLVMSLFRSRMRL